MNYPLVTIGIPTYNRADGFLTDAVTSALNQTYPNIEIIVSDNCSSDNTEAVIRSIDDPRIRYYKHKKNIGANNNFNFCVNQAKGVYFLLLSDDDLIDEDFIDVCMKAADYKSDAGIIKTGTKIIDTHGNIRSRHFNRAGGASTLDFIKSWFSNKTSMYLCSTLFNTEHLKEMGGFSSKNDLFQDVIAEFKLADKSGRIEIEDLKASFRHHPGERTVTKKMKGWCEDSLEVIDVLCQLVPGETTYIKEEGARFLSEINYSFARKAGTPFKRFMSYMLVFKTFNYRYPPPPVAQKLQSLKRRMGVLRK